MFKSATKIVLLAMTVVICLWTIVIVFNNLVNDKVVDSFLSLFNLVIGLVFWFYFRVSTTDSTKENKELTKG